MGQVTIIENTTGVMTPATDFLDTGWVIGGGIATHYPCNPGTMVNANVQGMIIGHTYNVTYDVQGWVSNGVNIFLGTTAGTTQSANVKAFSQNILCAGNTNISFYSNGQLSIANLVIYDLAQDTVPLTFAFNEKNKLWTETQSFVPDMMLRYGNDFFSFNNGACWKHNVNPVMGSFYGVTYPAQITFFINSDPGTVKLMQGIITESNTVWWCPNIVIKPYTGKSLGMQSRLKTGRFEVLQGVFYADFLRNLLDPRFSTQLQALLYGEELRGRTMMITIQNDDTTPAFLYKVQVKYAPQMLTP